MKILTLFFFLFTTAIVEAKVIHTIKDGAATWVVTLEQKDGLDTLNFKEQSSNKSYQFQTDSIAHHFIRLSSLTFSKESDLYFVTVWGKGAHGETLRVLHMGAENSDKLVVFSYNSAWPLEYEFKNGQLIVKGKGEMGEDGVPKEEVRTFKP